MTVQCSCGFTELSDEILTDHLLSAFGPAGGQGTDGLVHEETSLLACSCGLVAVLPGALDEHFLEVFTPSDRIGRDGEKHEAGAVTAGNRAAPGS
jgi:hypothetical protein